MSFKEKAAAAYIALALVFMLILAGLAHGQTLILNKVGDTKQRSVTVEVTYEKIFESKIIGFETQLQNVTIEQEVCTNITKSEQECTLQNVTSTRTVEDTSKPLFGEEKLIAISYAERQYTFDTKQCWVCSDQIACLSKTDGGANVEDRPEKFKCDITGKPIIRPGESGFIEELETQVRTFQRSDIGTI